MIKICSKEYTRPLKAGDEVITASISSKIDDQNQILQGLQVLESWGLIVKKSPPNMKSWGYLYGTDQTRYEELHPKKTAPLIACTRGGWGAARLLEYPQPWKKGWILGFSDITTILLARLSAGFDGGVHGPLLNTLAKEPVWSKERLKGILFGEKVPDLKGEAWRRGTAIGPVVAANLTVGSHLIGTKYLPNLTGAILILEDISEAPYRIERMMTQWRLAGLLQNLAGIGFGNFKNCENSIEENERNEFKLMDILLERTKDLEIPILGRLPIGHCCGNAALPLGRKVLIDGNHGSLKLLND